MTASLAFLAGSCLLAALPTVRAQTFVVRHTFPTTGTSFTANNRDGTVQGPLLQGSDGAIYGTSGSQQESGGGADVETIFRIDAAGNFATLHTFSQAAEGSHPSGLTQATDGNYYGVLGADGANRGGGVFQLTPAGQFTLLYSFSGPGAGVIGGPAGPVVQGADGALYFAVRGGASNGGAIARFDVAARQASAVYSFGTAPSGPALDGTSPNPVVLGPDGALYGSTAGDGANGGGTVYRVTLGGQFTLLYTFTALASERNADGYVPGPLNLGPDGNFYGQTSNGGVGGGTIFRVSPAGQFAAIYAFDPSTLGTTGSTSVQRLALTTGPDGNLYGVSAFGGASKSGFLFRTTPAGQLTDLHDFSASGSGNTDGNTPTFPLALGSDKNLYGTTLGGGVPTADPSTGNQEGFGTVFELNFGTTPPPSAGEVVGVTAKGATFTLTRTGDPSVLLKVKYAVGGGAVAGRDYQVLPGVRKLKPGKASVTIVVAALPGGQGKVKLKLLPGKGYTVDPGNPTAKARVP